MEIINDEKVEIENENRIEGDIVDDVEKEINELKQESMVQREFDQSLEQFWNHAEVESTIVNSRTFSTCSSENLSIFTSQTDLHTNVSKKKLKSKFKIPKTRSTINFNKVKSRYMDVFK